MNKKTKLSLPDLWYSRNGKEIGGQISNLSPETGKEPAHRPAKRTQQNAKFKDLTP